MIKKDASWISGKHLKVTIFSGLLFLICACVNAGMTNTIMPKICDIRGWEYARALPFMSYGGYIGAAATLIFAQLTVKKGAKFTIVSGLILGGFSLFLYGYAQSFVLFVAAILGNRIFSCAYQQAGGTVLINNWFPRKKGIVLGWATMGIILSDIIWSPYIPKVIQALGAPVTMAGAGILFLGLAIFAMAKIRNVPEHEGCYPDNDSSGLKALAENRRQMEVYESPFTWKRLIRTPQVWQIGVGWGLLWMIAVAFVSQLVRRCVSIGYEPSFAIRVLQIASLVGLAGSWLFGWIDTKYGSKTATTVYAVAIAVFFALGLLQEQGAIFVWSSACGIMACVGGIANLAPSMVGTVFGRWDFPAANRVISPIIMAVSSSAFLLASAFLSSPWGYNGMYAACIGLALLCLILVRATDDRMIGKL